MNENDKSYIELNESTISQQKNDTKSPYLTASESMINKHNAIINKIKEHETNQSKENNDRIGRNFIKENRKKMSELSKEKKITRELNSRQEYFPNDRN